jgi:hypothetical protein
MRHSCMVSYWAKLSQVGGGLALLAALLVIPSVATGGSTKSPTLKHYADSEISFRYPSDWRVSHYTENSSFSSSIVFLSNQKLHAPCRSFKVPVGLETTCGQPLKRLARNGVLLTWTADGTPTFSIQSVPGIAGKIGGLSARLEVDHPGECRDIGAGVTVTAVAVRGAPADNNFFELIACLRGPNLKSATDQVGALLRSTTFPGLAGT